MAYINIYGANIVYDRWGEGPLRVLVAYRAADWRGCPLQRGYEYIAPDMPGHGRSASQEGLADDELAEYLLGLLTMLHATEGELLVHSRARAIGDYLSNRLDMRTASLPGC